MKIKKLIILCVAAMLVFSLGSGTVQGEESPEYEHNYLAHHDGDEVWIIRIYCDTDQQAALLKTLATWAYDSSIQLDIIQSIIAREFAESEFGAGLSIIVDDIGLIAEIEAFLETLSEDGNPLREEECDHNSYSRYYVEKRTRTGGPNAQYCEWGNITTWVYCSGCSALLTTIVGGTYYESHTFVSFPPNIIVCSRCGYSAN